MKVCHLLSDKWAGWKKGFLRARARGEVRRGFAKWRGVGLMAEIMMLPYTKNTLSGGISRREALRGMGWGGRRR